MSAKKQKISQEMEENLKKNKYVKTLLLSYYMLTRNEDVLSASEKFNDQTLVENIYEEFKKYIAGLDCNIMVESVMPNEIFRVPDSYTIKPINILSILRKTPKVSV